MAIKSFGLAVTIGGVSINGLTDAQITGRDVTAVDTTAHDTEDNARTFIGGLIDNGTLEITANYSAADASFDSINAIVGTVVAASVTFSDASSVTFDVLVGPPNIENPLDDKPTWTCSCKISGPIA